MGHIIIIGGGAAGLMAGIMAARNKHRVTILEHKDKAGKKILATGNGKCNFTNLVQNKECYRSEEVDFPLKVINQFDLNKTIDFFKEIGIYPKEKKGYIYPNSEQAASITEVLLAELKYLKVEMILGVHVDKIIPLQQGFLVHTNDGEYKCHKVILASGGQASPNLGSDGSGYKLAKDLGHIIIKPLPALVQLKADHKFLKTISGVRCHAKISLFMNQVFTVREEGELLFAAYGVSGIPVMQISRFAAKALDEKKKADLLVDFFPELSEEELSRELTKRCQRIPLRGTEEAFTGLLNHKLMFVLLNEAKIPVNLPCNQFNQNKILEFTKILKGFHIVLSGTNSFEQAQVCAGGIATNQIDSKTMESKVVPGLYVCGEVLDVDGTCGGYNLQWAWSSGAVAGNNV
ncbi:MAG: NAD(P)/FAD-dependent oxidoreductase [Anaerocolumna sp.]